MATRFSIIEHKGAEGGFGKVEKATDNELERYVAIKTLDPLFKLKPSTKDIERFRREAKILAKFTHPNIPAIYDVVFDKEKEEFKLIFEWIEGLTVKASFEKRGLMSLEDVRKWFANICSALEHAHSNGVIHRDVKPSNLIITENLESCYLVDFGIALRPDDLERLTGGTPIGTPGYMSPEQERGDELDQSTDLFSLGIVLYECLSGIRPTVGEYRSLNSYNQAIPPTIDNLVQACIAERDNRLRSSAQFYNRLKLALQPHADFAKVLTDGPLHEIQLSISKMTTNEYANLPAGQRRLIMTRLKDLITVDETNMQSAVASIISELIRVATMTKQEDYEYIVQNSLIYGYEKRFGDNWMGNIQVRDELNNVAKECSALAHKIICENLSSHIENAENLPDKEGWYYHDIRDLLQNLLANVHCADDHVDKLGNILEEINQLSHVR